MPSFKKSLIVEQFQGNYLKACFKRRTTAVLSWLDCSCGCSMKLAPHSNRMAAPENKTQK